MSFPRRNLELKARLADLPAARAAAERIATQRGGVLKQTDTYFSVPRGRLKLREFSDRPAELIAYSRPDVAATKASDYHVAPVADALALREALTAALGVATIVHKRRELYWFHNVRIHLDEVAGLGTFLEFEAVVVADADESLCKDRLQFLSETFSLRAEDLVDVSYADMLTAGRPR